jgi:uncharacterized protein YjeT (DUF2065 family)
MNQRSIEVLALIYFLVIGLSHLFQPHAWVDYFTRLRDQGRSGMFTEGFLSLSFGALVVGFHHVWSGPAVVLTVIGWAQVVKGLVRFVFPQLSLRVYGRVSHERANDFRIGGVFALAIASFLGCLLLRTPASP